MRRRAFLAGAALLPLAACAAPVLKAPPGVTLTHVKSWSAIEGRALLALAGVKGVPVRHTVDAWRMTYPSHDAAGRPIVLSGLLALPRGVVARGLVSWQHGTTTSRTEVPSALATEGMAVALVFGGSGRAAIAPDYIGLGVSPLTHPYLVADDAVRAVADMLSAARGIAGVPAAAPFLTGFSQGGHASLATQQALEAKGEPVAGVAAIAGPHNLRTISLPAAMAGGAPSHSLYLSYMVRGYAARYGQPMESVLTPAAAKLTRTLYDTPHEGDAIIAALPAKPRTLFQPAFLDAFDTGAPNWLLDALAANETSHFTPKAPVRLYYGSADVDVLPREALATAAAMKARGADIEAIDVGPVGHDPSALAAAPRALAWLESLPA